MDPSVRAACSAEMPLVPPLVAKLVAAMDEGRPYGYMYETFQEMVAQVQQQAQGTSDAQAMLAALDKIQENDKAFRAIFHSISRPLLRSLVLGRLASDLWDEKADGWKNVYQAEGAGTYALAMHVVGRDGAWVTRSELAKMDGLLETYGEACVLFASMDDGGGGHSVRLTPAQRKILEITKRIDAALRPTEEDDEDEKENPVENKDENKDEDEDEDEENEDETENEDRGRSVSVSVANSTQTIQLEKPRFMTTAKDKLVYIRRLRESLRRRVPPTLSLRDPYQLASPLQIGCSTNLARRLTDHNPTTSNMSNSSKLLGLLTSCMGVLNLRAVIVGVPIVCAWEKDQIAFSEILVHVLAGSFVTARGLNVAVPGVPPRMPVEAKLNGRLFDGQVRVWLDNPWFMENMRITGKCGGSWEDYHRLQVSNKASRALDERIRQGEDRLAAARAKGDAAMADIHKMLEEAETKDKEMEEEVAELAKMASRYEKMDLL